MSACLTRLWVVRWMDGDAATSGAGLRSLEFESLALAAEFFAGLLTQADVSRARLWEQTLLETSGS